MVISCGILFYKLENNEYKYLLVHPGGEHNKYSSWGIPKGLMEINESDHFAVAVREVTEELGCITKEELWSEFYLGKVSYLGERSYINRKKKISIFSMEKDINTENIQSNVCDFFWKGAWIKVPEIDSAKYFTVGEAHKICHPIHFKFVYDLNMNLWEQLQK